MNLNWHFDHFSSHITSEEHAAKMSELENKVKKEAEMREEQLLKRLAEKEKMCTKMKWVCGLKFEIIWINSKILCSGVVEAYEKTIAELLSEKENVEKSCDRKCLELRSDSELNANHLASLEATFSDLHA